MRLALKMRVQSPDLVSLTKLNPLTNLLTPVQEIERNQYRLAKPIGINTD